MASKTQASSSTQEINKAFDALTGGFGTGFDSVMKANAQASKTWMENWQKVTKEFWDYCNTRWRTDLETMRELSECKDPIQAMQLQASAVQNGLKQNMDEAAKLADMASDASVNCFKQIDEGLRQANNMGAKAEGKQESKQAA